MRVDFYHLTRVPAEGVLPLLAEKVIGAGGQLLIISESAAQLDRLDEALWTFKPTSFLPHARAGGDNDGDQPILLAAAIPEGAPRQTIALADGRWREAALDFARALFLFTPDVIDDARGVWRTLADAEGVERHYWKQDEDRKWKEGP